MKAAEESGIYAWKVFIRKELEPCLKDLHVLVLKQDSDAAQIQALEEWIGWFIKSMRCWLDFNFEKIDDLNSLGFLVYHLENGDVVWDLENSSDRALRFKRVLLATSNAQIEDSRMLFRSGSKYEFRQRGTNEF